MTGTRPVVAGNWKMHLGPRGGHAFLRAFEEMPEARGVEVILFPPAVTLGALGEEGRVGSWFSLGAQNVHWEDSGAFTGEISVPMALEAGATHILVGHSERRHVFGETDAEVALKVQAVLRHGLIPVICVGELIEERRAGDWERIVLRQVDAAASAIAGHPGAPEFLVAYEPVWAIGTGETATPADAAAAHRLVRGRLSEILGRPSQSMRILYGGSVKPGNAGALMSEPEVDGVLVGGASLDPGSFAQIIAAAEAPSA